MPDSGAANEVGTHQSPGWLRRTVLERRWARGVEERAPAHAVSERLSDAAVGLPSASAGLASAAVGLPSAAAVAGLPSVPAITGRQPAAAGQPAPAGTDEEPVHAVSRRRWFSVVARRRWVVVSVAAGTGILVAATVLLGTGGQPSAATFVGCTGEPITVTIATSARTFPVLDRLAKDWTATRPVLHGRCLAARVTSQESSRVAATLGPDWNTRRDGVRPDVWVPESSLWLSMAEGRPDASGLIPPQSPSIASSPVVLALRQPMAQALGWPGRTLNWTDVVEMFMSGGWAKTGHPEWASLRMGMTDASTTTAGLAAVLAVVGDDVTGALTDDQLVDSLRFDQALGAVAPDTSGFFAAQAGTAGADAGIAAFPALESEVAAFDQDHPEHPLVPVYAAAPVVADYPYSVLSTSWVTAGTRAAAEQFLTYLRSSAGQDALGVIGLRDVDHSVRDSATLPVADGFPTTFSGARAVPDALVIGQLIADWTSLQRRSDMLVALDTSGSMAEPVPGTSLTRLQLMRQAATTGFGLLGGRDSVGLWGFSGTGDGPDELVAFGSATAAVDGVDRRQAMLDALGQLSAHGGTPLYDTVYAAYQEMRSHWQPDSVNAILVITDGSNDVPGGMTLAQLLSALKSEQRSGRPVQIINIALGPEADADALRQISAATGGRTFVAENPATAVQTLVLAFAGRLS
ncbi:substrate-binding and VWA domain-containing protein [Rugosimonospora africana]|uniref:VWA domain-containing protein n=1 Tax=Rugosimonospora africana TaxID=556532 RepID=A0A8J3VMT1_9ACTN|nr:substrate-binding and VWA domain-containing protein [Rugosimonospora africana]GIH12549.1 VWA domain-containing protein [Rugosimonospora africana]